MARPGNEASLNGRLTNKIWDISFPGDPSWGGDGEVHYSAPPQPPGAQLCLLFQHFGCCLKIDLLISVEGTLFFLPVLTKLWGVSKIVE